jgi:hypothetical protein
MLGAQKESTDLHVSELSEIEPDIKAAETVYEKQSAALRRGRQEQDHVRHLQFALCIRLPDRSCCGSFARDSDCMLVTASRRECVGARRPSEWKA